MDEFRIIMSDKSVEIPAIISIFTIGVLSNFKINLDSLGTVVININQQLKKKSSLNGLQNKLLSLG